MSNVKLAAIINSFNRLPLLKKALPALVSAFRQCPFAAAVVVFEVGSKDGTVEWLRDYRQQVPDVPIEVVEPEPGADSSFSAGVNAACQMAAALYPQVENFLFYETDNWIAGPQPLLTAVKLLESRPELAAAGFTVLRHSGQPAGFGCKFPTVLDFLLGQQMTYLLKLDRPTLRADGIVNDSSWSVCDVVFTSPLLVRRKAWGESGGMDAGTFPFSDCDVDWSWRLSKLGWKMAVISTDGVVHDNEGELSGWSARRVVDFHRARLRLLCRHAGTWVRWLKPLLLTRHCAEFLLLHVLPKAPDQAKESIDKRRLLIKSVMKDYEVDPA